jgi:hypothetical protein
VLWTPRDVVAYIGVSRHQILLVVETLREVVPEVLLIVLKILRRLRLTLISVKGSLLATQLGVI